MNVLVTTSGFLLLVLQRKTYLGYSTRKKPKIQAPGTTFSNFSDEVHLEGGHEK